MNNPESFNSHERTAEPDQSSIEKYEEKFEKSFDKEPEDNNTKAEEARAEVLKTAINIEAMSKKAEKEARQSPAPRHSIISKKQKNDSFKRTISRVQSELPVQERVFSKIIHNKIVEKTSDVVGNTIARPNSVLFGSFSAFLLTLIAYSVAKSLGYQLSGSETMVAFLLGWLIGILFDYLKVLFSGQR